MSTLARSGKGQIKAAPSFMGMKRMEIRRTTGAKHAHGQGEVAPPSEVGILQRCSDGVPGGRFAASRQSDTTYGKLTNDCVQYGNQASLSVSYTRAAMLIRIPSFRERTSKETPPTSSGQAYRFVLGRMILMLTANASITRWSSSDLRGMARATRKMITTTRWRMSRATKIREVISISVDRQ